MYIQIIDNKKSKDGLHTILFTHDDIDFEIMDFSQSIEVGAELDFHRKDLCYKTMLTKKSYDIEYGGLNLWVDVCTRSVTHSISNNIDDVER